MCGQHTVGLDYPNSSGNCSSRVFRQQVYVLLGHFVTGAAENQKFLKFHIGRFCYAYNQYCQTVVMEM